MCGVAGARSKYLADEMNVIDLSGTLLAVAALSLQLHAQDSASGEVPSRVLRTLAALLLWLKPLHVLRLSPTVGPLVLMVGRMLRKDVLNWLLVLACIVLSFSAALFTLNTNQSAGRRGDGASGFLECVSPDAFGISGGWDQAFWYLQRAWESVLIGEGDFDCARSSDQQALALVLLYTQQVLVALLMVNQLIAMMGKSARGACSSRTNVCYPHFTDCVRCIPASRL